MVSVPLVRDRLQPHGSKEVSNEAVNRQEDDLGESFKPVRHFLRQVARGNHQIG